MSVRGDEAKTIASESGNGAMTTQASAKTSCVCGNTTNTPTARSIPSSEIIAASWRQSCAPAITPLAAATRQLAPAPSAIGQTSARFVLPRLGVAHQTLEVNTIRTRTSARHATKTQIELRERTAEDRVVVSTVARVASCCSPKSTPTIRNRADQKTANTAYPAGPTVRATPQVTKYPEMPAIAVAARMRTTLPRAVAVSGMGSMNGSELVIGCSSCQSGGDSQLPQRTGQTFRHALTPMAVLSRLREKRNAECGMPTIRRKSTHLDY